MTFEDLTAIYGGITLLTYTGNGYSVLDIEFPTRADGTHFAYAARQDCWKPDVTRVEFISSHDDGTVLYSVYLNTWES